tara:strand:+ start:334 stop:549 length:216 start_codon:yes stop_codon:yes gene_type:complete
MSKQQLRQKIKERQEQIIEMLLLDSENECEEDYLLDLQEIKKARTFKDVCILNMRDYKEEIKLIKEEVSNV